MILLLFVFSIFSAPVGCTFLWRRCVFLADGLSHASILAIVLSSILKFDTFWISLVVSIIVIGLIYFFRKTSDIYVSTNLVSSATVAVSMLISYLYHHLFHHHHHGSLCCDCFSENILQGKLESVTNFDISVAIFCGLSIVAFLVFRMKHFILVSFNRDISKVLGIRVYVLDLIFFLLAALFINVFTKAVGLLLLSSMLLFPALASKFISTSPLKMMLNSIIFSSLCSVISAVVHLSIKIPIPVSFAISSLILLFVVLFMKKFRINSAKFAA